MNNEIEVRKKAITKVIETSTVCEACDKILLDDKTIGVIEELDMDMGIYDYKVDNSPINHHTYYDDPKTDETVKVCMECHSDIHYTDKYPELTPNTKKPKGYHPRQTPSKMPEFIVNCSYCNTRLNVYKDNISHKSEVVCYICGMPMDYSIIDERVEIRQQSLRKSMLECGENQWLSMEKEDGLEKGNDLICPICGKSDVELQKRVILYFDEDDIPVWDSVFKCKVCGSTESERRIKYSMERLEKLKKKIREED